MATWGNWWRGSSFFMLMIFPSSCVKASAAYYFVRDADKPRQLEQGLDLALLPSTHFGGPGVFSTMLVSLYNLSIVAEWR